jgi:TM2 domain-containing membrane protein YozV
MSQWQPQNDPRRPATPPQWQPPQPPNLPQLYSQHPYPQPPPYWAQPRQQVAPKSVLGAVVISFFIPGTGAVYAGDKVWGSVILALWLVSIPLTLVTVGFVTGFICWIAGMISAGLAAQKWNREHGIVS